MLHTPTHKISFPKHTVTVFFRDQPTGQIETSTRKFKSALDAQDFCDEEVRWEDTVRVTCPTIEFDERGDFERLPSLAQWQPANTLPEVQQ